MKKLCATTGCFRPYHAAGYCSICYKRLRRKGIRPTPTRVSRPAGMDAEASIRWHGWTLVEHSWTPVDTECWEWNGIRDRQGYGQIFIGGRTIKVPKLAYETWCGKVDDGLVVRHRCDNPPCLNPGHLLLGTNQDNVNDKMERGRHVSVRGKDCNLSVRDDEQINRIRSLYAQGGWSYRTLGAQFNADPGYIGRIIRREIWSHLPELLESDG